MEAHVYTSASTGKLAAISTEVKDPMRDSLLSSDCEVELEISPVADASLLPSHDGGATTAPVLDGSCHSMQSSDIDTHSVLSTCGDDSGTSSSLSCPDRLKDQNKNLNGTPEFWLEPGVTPLLAPDGRLFSSDGQSVPTNERFQTSDASLQAGESLEIPKMSDGRTIEGNSLISQALEHHRTSEGQFAQDRGLLSQETGPSLNTEQLARLVTGRRHEEDACQADGTQHGQALQIVQQPRLCDELLTTNEQFICNDESLIVGEALQASHEQSSKVFSEPVTRYQWLQTTESPCASGEQFLPASGQVWEALGQCEDIYRPEADDESPFPSLSPERRENGQAELEFDDWQGQFEFFSPGLQDYPFVLPELINGVDLGGEGNRSVYRDLINTVKQLQSRVEVLGDNQSDSQDRIVRVKQENSVLQERVVVLEEQLREAEHRAEDRLAEEQRRNRELIQRVEREKNLTVENYAIKQDHLEKTNQRLEEEVQRLRAKADRHQRERNELENRLSEAQILVANSKEENKLLASQSKKELQEDHEQSAKVIEELRAEVERLTAALESTGRKRVPSTDSITASTDQLTAALTALRQENKSLEEQVEELQAQLLTRGLEEGRELITAAANQSLAAEFDAMTQEEVEHKERETVEELQKTLHDVQEANKQLRTYIDGILLTIVENHPQLLEVKRKSS
ncbi:Rab-binding domain FIP-RBD [Trinorchestia longiramus]|nr:Rab-binding domain FIP-RBD [Trinorchestia longiramus]